MGVWMGERKQAVGSGVHYLHGNLYHRKKKNLFQCGRQADTVL